MLDYTSMKRFLADHENRVVCGSVIQREDVIRKLESMGYRPHSGIYDLGEDWYDDDLLTVYVDNDVIRVTDEVRCGDFTYNGFVRMFKECSASVNGHTKESNMSTYEEKKGSNDMNMFGNIEFGISKDTNIASTLLGVAVKSSAGGWRIYDKDKKSIVDVGDFKPGEFPVYVVPTKTLKIGDLVKRNGSYLYVTELVKEGGVKGVAVDTGTVEEIVSVQNLLGMSIYTKVVSVMDGVMDDDADMTKLMMLSACAGGKAGYMNQMLPLLLLKGDKKTEGEEGGSSDKKLMKMAMLMAGCSGGDQSQILPLLLMDAI